MAAEQNKAEEKVCCSIMDTFNSCSIMSWKCPKKTGSIVAAGNALYFATYFELHYSLFEFFLMYAPLLALIAGAGMKFTGKVSSDTIPELNILFPFYTEENVVKMAKACFAMKSKAFKVIAPVLFWQDIAVSAATTLGLYVFTIFLGYVSLTSLAFLTFNSAFIYGKFRSEIHAAVGPHVCKAKKAVMELVGKIPVAKKAQ